MEEYMSIEKENDLYIDNIPYYFLEFNGLKTINNITKILSNFVSEKNDKLTIEFHFRDNEIDDPICVDIELSKDNNDYFTQIKDVLNETFKICDESYDFFVKKELELDLDNMDFYVFVKDKKSNYRYKKYELWF